MTLTVNLASRLKKRSVLEQTQHASVNLTTNMTELNVDGPSWNEQNETDLPISGRKLCSML